MTYRNGSRQCLERARNELNSGDDHRLKYAALELRMAMEAITYDRAAAYKDEFPESEYETWQPRKVMQVLLEVDPNADRDSRISIGREPSLGERPDEMVDLGAEKVLNLSTLKAHYDALGSYLHIPTLKQMKAGQDVKFEKLRARCMAVADALESALASPVWNLNFKQFATTDCECGKRVYRRLPFDGSPTVAVCECGTIYDVTQVENNQVHWQPRQVRAFCPNGKCRDEVWLLAHQVQAGNQWTCEKCGSEIAITLGLSVIEPSTTKAD